MLPAVTLGPGVHVSFPESMLKVRVSRSEDTPFSGESSKSFGMQLEAQMFAVSWLPRLLRVE